MKTTKMFLLALTLLGSMLLVATSAQAFAIYNNADYQICVLKWYDFFSCHITVGPHSKYNGEHGAGLSKVHVYYEDNQKRCFRSGEFSIPKGGWTDVGNTGLTIYDHNGNQKGSLSLPRVHCVIVSPDQKSGAAKP